MIVDITEVVPDGQGMLSYTPAELIVELLYVRHCRVILVVHIALPIGGVLHHFRHQGRVGHDH